MLMSRILWRSLMTWLVLFYEVRSCGVPYVTNIAKLSPIIVTGHVSNLKPRNYRKARKHIYFDRLKVNIRFFLKGEELFKNNFCVQKFLNQKANENTQNKKRQKREIYYNSKPKTEKDYENFPAKFASKACWKRSIEINKVKTGFYCDGKVRINDTLLFFLDIIDHNDENNKLLDRKILKTIVATAQPVQINLQNLQAIENTLKGK